MARIITDIKRMPAEAQLIAREADNLGLPCYYNPSDELPDLGSRLQVRDLAQVAPELEVAQYVIAIRNGDTFPPLVTTEDGHLIDGSTRTEAAYKAGVETWARVVVRVNYSNAPEPVVRRLYILGARLNQINGRRMSRDNVAAIIEYVIEEGDSAKTLAAKLNCSPSTVHGVLAQRRAITRAAGLGIAQDTLAGKHWQKLGWADAKITDPVFQAVVSLAADASLTANETVDVLRNVEQQHTEDAKLAYVAEEREASKDRIRGISVKPTQSAKARRACGALVVGFRSAPGDATERDPKVAGRHLRLMRDAYEVLGKMIAEQEGVDASIGGTGPQFRKR